MQWVADSQDTVVRRLGVEEALDRLLILEQGRNGQEVLRRGEVASPLAGLDFERHLARPLAPARLHRSSPVDAATRRQILDHQLARGGEAQAALDARQD